MGVKYQEDKSHAFLMCFIGPVGKLELRIVRDGLDPEFPVSPLIDKHGPFDFLKKGKGRFRPYSLSIIDAANIPNTVSPGTYYYRVE